MGSTTCTSNTTIAKLTRNRAHHPPGAVSSVAPQGRRSFFAFPRFYETAKQFRRQNLFVIRSLLSAIPSVLLPVSKSLHPWNTTDVSVSGILWDTSACFRPPQWPAPRRKPLPRRNPVIRNCRILRVVRFGREALVQRVPGVQHPC